MATISTTDIEQLEQQLKLLKANKSLVKLKEEICFDDESWYSYIHNIKINNLELEKNYREDDEYYHNHSCRLNFSYDFIKENGYFDDSEEDYEEQSENQEYLKQIENLKQLEKKLEQLYAKQQKNEKYKKLKENPFKYSNDVTKILKSFSTYSSKITKFNYDFIINFFDDNLNIDDILKPLLFQSNYNYKNFVIYFLNKKNTQELNEIAKSYNLTFKKKKPSKKLMIESIINLFVETLILEQEKEYLEEKIKKQIDDKKKNINYTVTLNVYKTSYSDYYQRYENTESEECQIKIIDNSGNHSSYNVNWNVNGDYGIQYSIDYDNFEKKKYPELFLMEELFDKVFNNYNEDWFSFLDEIKN